MIVRRATVGGRPLSGAAFQVRSRRPANEELKQIIGTAIRPILMRIKAMSMEVHTKLFAV
jgi:hypothetical protein